MAEDEGLDIPRFATLFDCHRPVERYLRLTGAARATTSAADGATIAPIDAFLMHQLAAFYPEPPAVIDLAADATGGASAAFWAAHPAVARVRVMPAGEGATDATGARGAWRHTFADVASRLGVPSDAYTLCDASPFAAAPPAGDEPSADSLPPLLVSIFAPDTIPADVVRLLQQTAALYPEATVLVLGVGPAGDGPALEGVVSFCAHGSPYRLVLARELCPFFASSRLAVVCARDDSRVDPVLRRVAEGFDGNFEFLSLAKAVVVAGQSAAAAAAQPDSSAAAGGAGPARPPDYSGLVERVRRAVQEDLPADAVVLAVGKGDDALLDLGGRAVRHFPEAENGGYAGHHPADAKAAIEHLERQRSRGAQFLLLPATAQWWLEHYAEFRRHLEQNYRVAVCRPDTCIVFDLRGAGATSSPDAAPTKAADYGRLVERVRRVAAGAIPPGAKVAVVSRGDPELLRLEGRDAVHFPAGDGGAYAGYHPKDAGQALRFLASSKAAGVRFLLFPATAFWWLDHYAELRRHLEAEARAVWSDDACRVFELPAKRGGEGAPGPGHRLWERIVGVVSPRPSAGGRNGSHKT